MQDLMWLPGVLVGLGVGAVAVWLWARGQAGKDGAGAQALREQLDKATGEVRRLGDEKAALQNEVTRLQTTLEHERAAAQEKLAVIEQARKELSDAFKALSSDALKANNESFLDLARATLEKYQQGAKEDLASRQKAIDELVTPVKEKLTQMGEHLHGLEVSRKGAYESLREHLEHMAKTQEHLKSETANLVKALRTPNVRGQWGEIQLRRVVELAGMLEHCDFHEQQSTATDDGRLRPDMVIRLPGERTIVVDAKVALSAYLDALDAPDEARRQELMKTHAGQIRTHFRGLSSKAYWSKLEQTPEFVVLFLPGESFFSAALEHDPALIEEGVQGGVVIATPTTLIALLKAVAYGWQQQTVAKSAQEVSRLGRELYDRLATFTNNLARVGAGLNTAVGAYNQAVGSLEGRVMVSARKFPELGAGAGKDLQEIPPVETQVRPLSLPEHREDTGRDQAG